MKVLPNFIYVGAAKAGSTWIYAALREHPQVFIPEAKRTFFFDRSYECGEQWYREHFVVRDEHLAVGEICHDYFLDPEVAGRIAATIPDARIVFCLRNPAERLVSAYLHEREHGNLDDATFSDFVGNDKVRLKSDYLQTLRPYFETFDRSRLLVLLYDDLRADPEAFYRQLCDFLGVDAAFCPSVIHRAVNRSRRVRFPGVARRLYRTVRSHSPDKHAATWKNRLRTRLMRLLEPALYSSTPARAHIDGALLSSINLEYSRDYPELQRMTGVRIPAAWSG